MGFIAYMVGKLIINWKSFFATVCLDFGYPVFRRYGLGLFNVM